MYSLDKKIMGGGIDLPCLEEIYLQNHYNSWLVYQKRIAVFLIILNMRGLIFVVKVT